MYERPIVCDFVPIYLELLFCQLSTCNKYIENLCIKSVCLSRNIILSWQTWHAGSLFIICTCNITAGFISEKSSSFTTFVNIYDVLRVHARSVYVVHSSVNSVYFLLFSAEFRYVGSFILMSNLLITLHILL